MVVSIVYKNFLCKLILNKMKDENYICQFDIIINNNTVTVHVPEDSLIYI